MSDTGASDARIRPAVPGEAEAIRELGRAAWHAAYDDILGPGTVDERIDDWWKADDLRDAIADPEHTFLVAASGDENEDGDGGGEPVGIVHAGPHPDPEADHYVVPRLYVHPDRWGEGIGTALVDRLRGTLGDATDRLRVVVLEGNEVGIGFYESYGFERVGEKSGLVDAGERELVYELRADE